MIPDSEKDFLYLADTLPKKYSSFYSRFEKVLNQCNIDFELLPQTKDIWAVDYMPIQIELDKFIQFVYNPSYLQTKRFLKTISDVDTICKEIRIDTLKTNIILDGGNIIQWSNKVIMTERVFKENPTYEPECLTRELYELLQVDKIHFVPEQPGDFTGHADGMVRFIDEHTVIINDYRKEKKSFQKAFEIAIRKAGLDYIRVPYNLDENESIDQANGAYINYLQIENAIIIPTFNTKEDEQAVKQFESIFTGQTVTTVESNEIANEGGVLNCITWGIKTYKQ